MVKSQTRRRSRGGVLGFECRHMNIDIARRSVDDARGVIFVFVLSWDG